MDQDLTTQMIKDLLSKVTIGETEEETTPATTGLMSSLPGTKTPENVAQEEEADDTPKARNTISKFINDLADAKEAEEAGDDIQYVTKETPEVSDILSLNTELLQNRHNTPLYDFIRKNKNINLNDGAISVRDRGDAGIRYIKKIGDMFKQDYTVPSVRPDVSVQRKPSVVLDLDLFMERYDEEDKVGTADVGISVVPDTTDADGGAAPSDGKGLMSRNLTQVERSSISDRGSEVNIARLYPITDDANNFSTSNLNTAIDKTIRNPIKKALLSGAIDVEVGNDGPITEGAGYRLTRAYEMFNDAIVDQALSSLPKSEQRRIRGGAASNALGMAIFDLRYDGGSNYRGRGLIQITGRDNYRGVQNVLQGQGINVDLVNNPELVNDSRYALPSALAFLEYAGVTDAVVEDISTKKLNNIINSGANRDIAEERWNSVISTLRTAGLNTEADNLELRNEYQAQETVGASVDGIIGPNTYSAIQTWATSNGRNLTLPDVSFEADGETPDQESKVKLAVFVNENSEQEEE